MKFPYTILKARSKPCQKNYITEQEKHQERAEVAGAQRGGENTNTLLDKEAPELTGVEKYVHSEARRTYHSATTSVTSSLPPGMSRSKCQRSRVSVSKLPLLSAIAVEKLRRDPKEM